MFPSQQKPTNNIHQQKDVSIHVLFFSDEKTTSSSTSPTVSIREKKRMQRHAPKTSHPPKKKTK